MKHRVNSHWRLEIRQLLWMLYQHSNCQRLCFDIDIYINIYIWTLWPVIYLLVTCCLYKLKEQAKNSILSLSIIFYSCLAILYSYFIRIICICIMHLFACCINVTIPDYYLEPYQTCLVRQILFMVLNNYFIPVKTN